VEDEFCNRSKTAYQAAALYRSIVQPSTGSVHCRLGGIRGICRGVSDLVCDSSIQVAVAAIWISGHELRSTSPYAFLRYGSCVRHGKRELLAIEDYAVRTFTTFLLLAACALSLGQSTKGAPQYSRTELKHLMQAARTAADFERLANYFDQKASLYDSKSHLEEKELNRLLALPFHARSYPAQVESTRNRIEHFKALFHTCSEQAATYRARAKGGEESTPAAAPPPASR
jgi:hypothetical protein